jgi:hypothetical protein
MVDMHSDMWIRPFHGEQMVEPTRKYPYVNGRLSLPGSPTEADESYFASLFKVHYQEVLFGNTLFKNQGNGKFEEISDKAGAETWWPWGIAAGDFDNDGFEDLFVPSGMGYPFWYAPNYLLMNNGDETFADKAQVLGIEPPVHGRYAAELLADQPAARSSRAAATADFRGDGRLDLVVNNFNDRPYYFQNRFPKRNFVAFRLTGTKSNRDAIGAVVRLYCGREVLTRQIQSASGYLAQSSRTAHFGLGKRQKIDRVEIKWPRGRVQTILQPEINKLHAVREPE